LYLARGGFQRWCHHLALVRLRQHGPQLQHGTAADRSGGLKAAIVTDAWAPQTNGVVQTLSMTADALSKLRHDVCVIHPGLFRTFPCPTYPEIRLAWMPSRKLTRLLGQFAPDAIHIATEGPLGTAARRWCLRNRVRFTTSYHTQFPEYLRARIPIPIALTYAHLRRFHSAAVRTMVATPAMQLQLEQRGFRNIVRWTRGVDIDLFRPQDKGFLDLPRPIAMYVGRVAIEKNLEAFLSLNLPGSKVVVGDGPARLELQRKFDTAIFVGLQRAESLAKHLAAADVFVFPSRTDTFGLVMLEALACGVPVAAFPVTGPIDVIQQGVTGVLDTDLSRAVRDALQLNPQVCRAYAMAHTWQIAANQFLDHLQVNAVSAGTSRAASCGKVCQSIQ
jgi:glycosyltransferase involved in cell wall biosynthesis